MSTPTVRRSTGSPSAAGRALCVDRHPAPLAWRGECGPKRDGVDARHLYRGCRAHAL